MTEIDLFESMPSCQSLNRVRLKPTERDSRNLNGNSDE